MRHLGKGAADASKRIKKGGNGGNFGKKNVITDQMVRAKTKQHRLVVPTHKLKWETSLPN